MTWPNALLIESPAWLWLCAALAIPVLIHLLRRSNPREITFAAAQWLHQKRHRHRKKLFLRDKLLLFLRLLLLFVLILLLAKPFLLRDARPSDRMLLVDPQVSAQALAQFISQHPQINESFWLQVSPTPIHSPRPQVTEVWPALSQLAGIGEFRRAHILLQNAINPDGHTTLQVSPHWQWHSVDASTSDIATRLPQIAQVGEGPPWLTPVIQQLAEEALPHLTLQTLPGTATLDAQDIDWVIYDTPGPLPEHLHQFVHDGGLLITDAQVTAVPAPKFSSMDTDGALEAAAIGRGSWLRYTVNWHSEDFFHRTQLPQTLWRQWSSQDWPWLHNSRGRWSIDPTEGAQGIPGIPVADTAVTQQFASPLHKGLLMALALLLLLERSVALSRRTAIREGGQRE